MKKRSLAACLALLLAAPLAAEPSRFKPQLVSRLYLGGAASMLFNDGGDLRTLLGPNYGVSSGVGFTGDLHLGYQMANGWALEAGYASMNRIIVVDVPTLFFGERYVFAQKAFYVEPLYRRLYGRRFTLGLGLNLGLTQDKVTRETVLGSIDATGGGLSVMPELKAQLLAGGLVGFEFSLGYKFSQASPMQAANGSTLYDYSAGGAKNAWHADNSGMTMGFGINLHLGRVATRPARVGKVQIPVNILGAENLPEVKEWNLKILAPDDTLIKEFKGRGPVPKVLSWDGLDLKGKKLDPDMELHLNLSTVDGLGSSSSTQAAFGAALQPRAWQMAAPLFSAGDDGKGGIVIASQFKRGPTEVKNWKLVLRDPQGRILKTFEGKKVLPRNLKWNLVDAEGKHLEAKDIQFSFEASDEEGPAFGEAGQVAFAVKPKEMMSAPPKFDSKANQIVFTPKYDIHAKVKTWTLNLKAADGKILKVVHGVGKLPKEFRFAPIELQAPGVNLAAEASGVAFIQYSLATQDEDGSQQVASDAFALDDEFGGEGSSGLSAGDYKVSAGKETLILVKPNLLSQDPQAARQGSFLLEFPDLKDPKSWRLNGLKGKGSPPSTLALLEASPSYVLALTGADSVEKESHGLHTMTRSFKYEGKDIKVQRVHAAWFEQGESEIQPEMLGRLERVADWLGQSPKAQVLIQGHSSKEGSSSFNDRLAMERAEAVKAWLVDSGKIPESRLQTRSYGTKLLLDEGESEDAIRRNRRIDVLILDWPDSK